MLDGRDVPLGELAKIALGLHQDMHASLCEALGVPTRSTYSTGAKRVLELLRASASSRSSAP